MPKMKSRSSLKKRIRVTGSGKLVRMMQFSGCTHIRGNKSKKRVRGYRQNGLMNATDFKRFKKLILTH